MRGDNRITELRNFFDKNTYLQVTATPQALFLQSSEHEFRPKFTVLSKPGSGYVGGDDFFGEETELIREFDINDIAVLIPGPQPAPALVIPPSLLRALDMFMVGATFKRIKDVDQNCAFLCHVSTKKADHNHIVELLRKYKKDLAAGIEKRNSSTIERLRSAYSDLASTHEGLRSSNFDDLVEKIGFFSRGIVVKLVNGETDEDVAVRSPYNLFVGGNKLGRGVTIKNLLVSYYGRNPRKPQADTVLQHARMYGYRRNDIGLLRLFLPRELHVVFRAINLMERGLRDLIARNPDEEFRGIYVENVMNPTRKNILVPGSLGIYSGGSNYNPAQILRNAATKNATSKIDHKLAGVENKKYQEIPIEDMYELIGLVKPDQDQSERVWDSLAIAESLRQYAKLKKNETGYVYVDRDRGLRENRRETAGVLTGGEYRTVPYDRVVLFMLRTNADRGEYAAWWPQVRFPDGPYAFAFSI